MRVIQLIPWMENGTRPEVCLRNIPGTLPNLHVFACRSGLNQLCNRANQELIKSVELCRHAFKGSTLVHLSKSSSRHFYWLSSRHATYVSVRRDQYNFLNQCALASNKKFYIKVS